MTCSSIQKTAANASKWIKQKQFNMNSTKLELYGGGGADCIWYTQTQNMYIFSPHTFRTVNGGPTSRQDQYSSHCLISSS